MALPILQIERKFNEINPDSYKTDFVFYGVINTSELQLFDPHSKLFALSLQNNLLFHTKPGVIFLIAGILL